MRADVSLIYDKLWKSKEVDLMESDLTARWQGVQRRLYTTLNQWNDDFLAVGSLIRD